MAYAHKVIHKMDVWIIEPSFECMDEKNRVDTVVLLSTKYSEHT
jgi:hypothetical protein